MHVEVVPQSCWLHVVVLGDRQHDLKQVTGDMAVTGCKTDVMLEPSHSAVMI